MRFRLILLQGITVFCSLLIMLVVGLISVDTETYRRECKNLETYLVLAKNSYSLSGNRQEVIDEFKKANPNIRITFIDLEGEVLDDSYPDIEYVSHKNRQELKNLGSIERRYSASLSCEMIYLANRIDGLYLRISIPVSKITPIADSFLYGSIVTFVIVMFISVFAIYEINKQALKPLNTIQDKLTIITKHEQMPHATTFEEISEEIDQVSEILNHQMDLTSIEKNKMDFALNQLDQVFLLLDEEGRVVLINDYALKILEVKRENVIEKDYRFAFRDLSLLEAINHHQDSTIDVVIGKRNFRFVIQNVLYRMVISATDITLIMDVLRMKRDFFANASHELKSPLTTIIGYQQLISMGLINQKEEIIESSNKTIREANRMNNIVIDMLELSKIEAIETIKKESISLNLILNEVIEHLGIKIKEKKNKMILEIKEVSYEGESRHFYSLFKNIIDNAIQYSPCESEIKVELTPLKFSVIDHGEGISKENQKRIFERFFRVDKARNKEECGTGLGLAIVKHLCQLYHFEIQLESEEGKGCNFTILFK